MGQLTEMGFSPEQATSALEVAGGSIELATNLLLTQQEAAGAMIPPAWSQVLRRGRKAFPNNSNTISVKMRAPGYVPPSPGPSSQASM